ncbi:hypothetical protein [Solirubrobacter soli]|uniref:hypothetical protein n=1 Tax=Solirubrobacter soli TaxID=363832 RepID=UPI0004234292|nr:hypothetical protein [Solirubrobacter soli]
MEGDERRGVRFTKLGFAAIVAVVALAGNAFQLLYSVDPTRKPDPNERLRAAIQPLSAEPQVSLGTYLARTTAPPEIERTIDGLILAKYKTHEEFLCAKERKLAVRGYMVYADITVEGLKHRAVDLYTTLYSNATHRRMAAYEGEAPLPPLKLTSPTDSFVQAAFLEVPERPRANYYARFELRTHEDGDKLGTLLAMADSKPFPGFEGNYARGYPHCPRVM